MGNGNAEDVTLRTVHEDLKSGFTDVKSELKAGFTDLKTALIAGFRSLPTRESSDEMIRLLRENNRIQEERLIQLDVRIREQHLENQQSFRALAEGQRAMIEQIASVSANISALIARLDALIRGRSDGSPSSNAPG